MRTDSAGRPLRAVTIAEPHPPQHASWAVQNNVHGIVTDTPQLEKNPWTGDAQLTAGTAALLFDTERLTQKQFQDMLDAQTEQGEVPLLAPSNENYGYVGKPAFKPLACCGATPAWDAFWFVVPWEAYQRYGDRRGLEQVYPAMRQYLDSGSRSGRRATATNRRTRSPRGWATGILRREPIR